MYIMSVKENMMDSSKFELWEKETATLEEANEEIVFNGTDGPFFTSGEGLLEFQLAEKYILAKVEEK